MKKRKRILLLEAEPILAEITAFRLELLGYQVDRASSANEAFDAIDQQRPDLIMVDMLLPGSNGYDVIDRLSNDERTTGIPVMALSSNADLDEVQRAFLCGAKDYLVIPYDPVVLEEKLEKMALVGH